MTRQTALPTPRGEFQFSLNLIRFSKYHLLDHNILTADRVAGQLTAVSVMD